MRIYEEYETPVEKKRAQRGAKRGHPTGKARGYCIIFPENGRCGRGFWDGVGATFFGDPGCRPHQAPMSGSGIAPEYLARDCRRVAVKYLNRDWRAVWDFYAAQ